MAELSQIAQLEERRRRLLVESESYRQQIAREVEALRSAAAWADRGYSMARSVRSLWPALTLLGGIFAARKGGFLLRTLGKGWSLWQLGKRLEPVWRRWLDHFSKSA